MALYAFDGTRNKDKTDDVENTNVVCFKELYEGDNIEYVEGVGTRLGILGMLLGTVFGMGARTRIKEMYEALCENWERGDKVIDIIGFSRGAALAVHFANKIGKEGVRLSDGRIEGAGVRFLGLWDIVGSFGLPFNIVIDFQKINLWWNIDVVHRCVGRCFHAMALDERRHTFTVTRLDPHNRSVDIREVWFRGVHSDIGGGNRNKARSNIALQWMLEQGRDCGLAFDEEKAKLPHYNEMDHRAPIFENTDVVIDPRRKIHPDDEIHPDARSLDLAVDETHTCKVCADEKYNWSGIRLRKGAEYTFTVLEEGATWYDGNIPCGPAGWESEQLPWYKKHIVKMFEKYRRLKEANWFALTGALGNEDEQLFLIGDKQDPYLAPEDAGLYLFANDLAWRYGNNKGSLMVTITRIR